ncbi:hypothetical protein [Yersinia intermedia]|uniref:hypothetical protein n=1 Tax=Yersinia intermedia TaxID=631 RepID=UPI000678EE9E|nr:hypothetical protein [Yersinia intermedia]
MIRFIILVDLVDLVDLVVGVDRIIILVNPVLGFGCYNFTVNLTLVASTAKGGGRAPLWNPALARNIVASPCPPAACRLIEPGPTRSQLDSPFRRVHAAHSACNLCRQYS